MIGLVGSLWKTLSQLLLTTLLIAGCAHPTGTMGTNDVKDSFWRGRLALQVGADGNAPQTSSAASPQSFFAAFELTGNAESGQLAIFSPLGSTLATLNWAPQFATLRANGETRQFETLGAMLKSTTGAEIPVGSLFAWLSGESRDTPGWIPDLSQISNGKLAARRSTPQPVVDLRIVLEP